MDNKMSISAPCELLKAHISAFRVTAHTTTVHTQTVAQHITVHLMCMVLVKPSVHTLCDLFKDLRSDHRYGLKSKIISPVSFACTSDFLSMWQKTAYLQNACFLTFFMLVKTVTTDKYKTSILILLAVSSNNRNIEL